MQHNQALNEQRRHYVAVRARLNTATVRVAAVREAPPVVVMRRFKKPIGVMRVYPYAIGPTLPTGGRDILMLSSEMSAFDVAQLVKFAVVEICRRHGVDLVDVYSDRRKASIVKARQECMWWVKKHTTWSLPKIGKHFGDRDHTTVIHGVAKHEQRLQMGLAI